MKTIKVSHDEIKAAGYMNTLYRCIVENDYQQIQIEAPVRSLKNYISRHAFWCKRYNRIIEHTLSGNILTVTDKGIVRIKGHTYLQYPDLLSINADLLLSLEKGRQVNDIETLVLKNQPLRFRATSQKLLRSIRSTIINIARHNQLSFTTYFKNNALHADPVTATD